MRHAVVCILVVMHLVIPGRADNLSGVVTNTQGDPVVGARVDISTAAPKSRPGLFCPSCYLDCAKSTRSDAQGLFEFTSLDPTLKFRLLASAPGTQTATTGLLDPRQGFAAITLPDFPADTPENRILRGTIHSVEGVPVSGALIEPHGAKTATRRWGGRVEGAKAAVTDDDGHFRMLLTEDFVALDLEVTAHGYPGAVVELLQPGEGPHRITVPSGTSVIGQLTFRGRPQADQPISVVQVNRGRHDRIFIKAVMATTDENGRFHFTALPAGEPYAIFTPVGSGVTGPVLPTMLFEALEDNATRDLGELDLVSGLTLAGRLQMADDTTLSDGIRITLGRMPAWDLIEVPVESDGSFRIENLPPETYEIALRTEEVVLDELRCNFHLLDKKVFGLRLTDSHTDLSVPLRRASADDKVRRTGGPSRPASGNQTVSGKVVDRNGSPLSGINLSPRLLGGGFIRGKVARTRADGRFTIRNLPDEPIALMIYESGAFGYPTGTAGRMTLYPGHVWPTLNQSDVRIVLDPELTTPPVDLHWDASLDHRLMTRRQQGPRRLYRGVRGSIPHHAGGGQPGQILCPGKGTSVESRPGSCFFVIE